jgi:hypothetical protein
VIDPFKQILDRHADAQGWDADTREHVLLQFVANAEDVVGTAADLDTFLTDLTADADEGDDDEEPRLRCYTHAERLQELITAGSYTLSRERWIELDARLGALVRQLTDANLQEPEAHHA